MYGYCGVIPGEMMSDHTRVWSYTGLDYVADQAYRPINQHVSVRLLDEGARIRQGVIESCLSQLGQDDLDWM